MDVSLEEGEEGFMNSIRVDFCIGFPPPLLPSGSLRATVVVEVDLFGVRNRAELGLSILPIDDSRRYWEGGVLWSDSTEFMFEFMAPCCHGDCCHGDLCLYTPSV